MKNVGQRCLGYGTTLSYNCLYTRKIGMAELLVEGERYVSSPVTDSHYFKGGHKNVIC